MAEGSALPQTLEGDRRRKAALAGEIDTGTIGVTGLQQYALVRKAAEKALTKAQLAALRSPDKKFGEITMEDGFAAAETNDLLDLAAGAKLLASKHGARIGMQYGYGWEGVVAASRMIRERANDLEYEEMVDPAAKDLVEVHKARRSGAFA